jgi:hypothetical protein
MKMFAPLVSSTTKKRPESHNFVPAPHPLTVDTLLYYETFVLEKCVEVKSAW